MKDCFGTVLDTVKDECYECSLFGLCSMYAVVDKNDGCPEFGNWSYRDDMCKICTEYFGEACKKRKLARKR